MHRGVRISSAIVVFWCEMHWKSYS